LQYAEALARSEIVGLIIALPGLTVNAVFVKYAAAVQILFIYFATFPLS
jgi:hypothetical protein